MPKRGAPRPGPGQLTLQQALSRAVRERVLPETDDDEPKNDTLSSSSTEDDASDDEWCPPGPGPKRRTLLEEAELPIASSSRG